MTETIKFNEINEVVENIARKYSRNTSISSDDFSQELWVKACEMIKGGVSDIAFLTRCLVNKAIDISRLSWRNQNNETVMYQSGSLEGVSISHDTPSSDYYLFEESNDYCDKVSKDEPNIEIEIEMMINELHGNAYKYTVAKAYLNGNLVFLADKYNELLKDLTIDEINLINSFEGRYTDDIILKVFCGIKSGTNSGSARTIKKTVRDLFLY